MKGSGLPRAGVACTVAGMTGKEEAGKETSLGAGEGRRVGVREVAAEAGVSFSTAAAALRGDPWVKDSTRKRVEAFAAELGYQRDMAASILASRRGHRGVRNFSIAYITAVFSGREPGRFKERMAGLKPEAEKRGFHFERIEIKNLTLARQVGRRLVATGVDGLILGPMEAETFLPNFPVQEFPIVADSRGLVMHGVDAVRANHFTAVQRLLRRLRERGYKRYGAILRYHDSMHPDDYARHGALVACRDLDTGFETLEIQCWPFFKHDKSLEQQNEDEAAFLRIWQKQHQFEVIIGFDQADAELLERAFPKASERPDYAAMLVRPAYRDKIAGIAFDQEVLVAPMIDRLVEKIRMRQLGLTALPLETVVDLPFVDGQSLRRREAALSGAWV